MRAARFRPLYGVLLTGSQPCGLDPVVRLLTPKEVGDMHSQRVRNEEQVRELRVALGVLVALDAAAFHAGEVGHQYL